MTTRKVQTGLETTVLPAEGKESSPEPPPEQEAATPLRSDPEKLNKPTKAPSQRNEESKRAEQSDITEKIWNEYFGAQE